MRVLIEIFMNSTAHIYICNKESQLEMCNEPRLQNISNSPTFTRLDIIDFLDTRNTLCILSR